MPYQGRNLGAIRRAFKDPPLELSEILKYNSIEETVKLS